MGLVTGKLTSFLLDDSKTVLEDPSSLSHGSLILWKKAAY